MILYLIKLAACMALFLVFYKLLLEKENMHVFKRFYLLLAIAASLFIPTLVFTEYVVVEPISYEEIQPAINSDNKYIDVPEKLQSDIIDVAPILWCVYFLGLFFLGFKFIKNLFQIVGRIRKNPKQKSNSFIHVLLKENFPPHTFFKYIFLNKKKLESNEIPKEVLLHEETHARQKHSLDVVFIELLQVVFWFNPLVYLFKKAIKLNHEFLADQAVLNAAVDHTTYQNTLLSYLSPDSEKKYPLKMTNAINYSSIKKRFAIMKTKTSKRSILFRSILLLPLLAILVLGFSKTVLVQQESNIITKEIETTDSFTSNQIDEKGKQPNDQESKTLENNSTNRQEDPDPFDIVITNTHSGLKFKCLSGCSWIDLAFSLPQNKSQKVGFNGMINNHNSNSFLFSIKKISKLDIALKGLEGTVWNNLKFSIAENETQRLNQFGMVSSVLQKEATKKQREEYNALAKKYNTMLSKSKSVEIKMKDVERLKYLYGLMSDTQKAAAEAFPNFPEPPPQSKGPEAPKTPHVKEGEKSNNIQQSEANLNDLAYADKVIEKTIKNQDIYDHLTRINDVLLNGTIVTNDLKSFYSNEEQNKTDSNANQDSEYEVSYGIENPERPKESYVKQLIDMNKKGAVFYHRGEEISFYKALDLLYNKRNLMLATFNMEEKGTPFVILDRNFKKYDVKELINSHLD